MDRRAGASHFHALMYYSRNKAIRQTREPEHGCGGFPSRLGMLVLLSHMGWELKACFKGSAIPPAHACVIAP